MDAFQDVCLVSCQLEPFSVRLLVHLMRVYMSKLLSEAKTPVGCLSDRFYKWEERSFVCPEVSIEGADWDRLGFGSDSGGGLKRSCNYKVSDTH